MDFHNKYRSVVAAGNLPGQPAAQYMMEMKYDENLAVVAQRWADQCSASNDQNRIIVNVSDTTPIIAGCGDVEKWQQNIAITTTTTPAPTTTTPKPTTKKSYRAGNLNCSTKATIVELHNKYRSVVASGNLTNQPAAENMMEMKYEEELA
ncbi:hypothetical protein B566_EDAN012852, partial [Ephemera danica]